MYRRSTLTCHCVAYRKGIEDNYHVFLTRRYVFAITDVTRELTGINSKATTSEGRAEWQEIVGFIYASEANVFDLWNQYWETFSTESTRLLFGYRKINFLVDWTNFQAKVWFIQSYGSLSAFTSWGDQWETVILQRAIISQTKFSIWCISLSEILNSR